MRLVEGVASVGDVDAFVADLGDIGGEHGAAVQAFDADYVAGREHLASAVAHANRAFERGDNVASDRAVEVLLYAAGRRQIRRALAMGVDEGDSEVVVVVDGGDEATLREFFDVGEAESAAAAGDLADVVRERVALLDVEK